MVISREIILRLDKAQEDRQLEPHEEQLRKLIKVSYLGLASLDRTITRQRSCIANLKDGDANTAFFHRQSTYRRQKPRIYSIAHDGHICTTQDEMAKAAFEHFEALLGTATSREHTIDLMPLIEPSDLQDLDRSFSLEVIWDVVKHLPAHKAPGPDGFTAEFMRACWAVVKHDFPDVFQQLYEI
jgi:hypothetical protein